MVMVKWYRSSQETKFRPTERHLPCGITALPTTQHRWMRPSPTFLTDDANRNGRNTETVLMQQFGKTWKVHYVTHSRGVLEQGIFCMSSPPSQRGGRICITHTSASQNITELLESGALPCWPSAVLVARLGSSAMNRLVLHSASGVKHKDWL